MNSKNSLDYTTRDYDGFRNLMLNKLTETLPSYTDTRQSDAGIVLLESVAMALDILSYYLDSIANECYLNTAEQRSNIMKLCKMLGYTPRFATAAKYKQVFERTNTDEALVIPAGTRLKTKSDNPDNVLYFSTLTDLVIPTGKVGNEKSDGTHYDYTVDIIHGLYVEGEELTDSATGVANQTYSLNYTPVLVDSTLMVYVTNNSNNNSEKWSRVESFAGSSSSSKVYMVEVDDYNNTNIIFGNGSLGQAPPENSTITCSYYVGGGDIGNVGNQTIIELEDSISVVSDTYNVEQLEYGYDIESTESIKSNAIIAHRTLWGALTEGDFSGLCTETFPNVLYAQSKKASTDWTTPEVDDLEIYILTKGETLLQENDLFDITSQELTNYYQTGGEFDNAKTKIEDFFNSNTDYVKIENGTVVDTGRKLIGTRNIEVKHSNLVKLSFEVSLKLWEYYDFDTVSSQVHSFIASYFKWGNIPFNQEISMQELAYSITNSIEGIRYLTITPTISEGSAYCTTSDNGNLITPKVGALFVLTALTINNAS